jgi:hypothetical protein
VKQQDGKQEKIDQTLHLLPNRTVQGCEAANQIAAKDQGKIREKKFSKVHSSRIAKAEHEPSQ